MPTLADTVTDRVRRPDFEEWMKGAAATGYCANPVRLVGSSHVVDAVSGEVVSSYESARQPDGITYVRCGNRRAVRCPSCSREYKGDMWHLVVAGAAGGSKDVPESVGTHPLVFLTLTAPSFGAVHAFKKARGSGSTRCRPRSKKELCPHGRPVGCMSVHDADSPLVGEPICRECYDYVGHIVWQWHAPELWRRFTIALRRRIAQSLGLSETATRKLVRVQFAKVAEFQKRGLVHFHALIRLDGDARPDDPYPAPSVLISSSELSRMAIESAAAVQVTASPVVPGEAPRSLRFGRQVDARAVVRHHAENDGELTDRAVAAYIAKYATKATEDVDPSTVANGPRPHVAQLKQTIEDLARITRLGSEDDYALLGKWVGMLGFRGHFATKSRRYSTTLGKLRAARRLWQKRISAKRDATHGVESDEEDDELDDETTLVVAQWSFAGMGWLTNGDAALAAEAAAHAREWNDQRREQMKTNQNKER
ncbi:replication initiation protein [Rathayibacter rathayi]|uniref:Replication initiation protein n=1 Tax=Rathayibacter rathayi TaxID=33887 RepID=A0ABD6W8U4_RATRA|nr:replication initiator [Rathayibacter rathayi]AZZ49692.1 replication initiation protein [Rathayibacter rathayi]MWV75358.1 replication initiation protein [Rathayibacter rathayi NCPPB 2980 = VKM Ac-1601]PPF14036.1 replication initiation protein [Rathayibacter rathayi]PPG13182.1 replication initiation protein [Rathayibacter rathayi]PPG43489.1 replication initiation protein [Rathayibacter rathayi]